MSKPLLIFDGDCGFCRFWVKRWLRRTEGQVETIASQELGERAPQVPRELFERSVVLVEPDGSYYHGAESVCRTLDHGPGRPYWLWLYQRVPGVRPLSELAYRFVAARRPWFSRATRIFIGPDPEPPLMARTAWLFLRALGVIFLIAFGSLYTQCLGLYGSSGIMPISGITSQVLTLGPDKFFMAPSLFWFGSSDAYITGVCAAGMAASLLLLLDLLPGLALLVCYACYLSFMGFGQDFMSFQWDALLLETAVLALLLDPFKWKPGPREPSHLAVWLIRLLLFKLMLQSAAVKLLSGDQTWRGFTALEFHYLTQPLPPWTAWYTHQLPAFFQKFSVLVLFLIEGIAPFFLFLPRFRSPAAILLALLQLLIILTGNYCFFNLLTLALCLLCLDDRFLPSLPWEGGRGGKAARVDGSLWPARLAALILLPLTLSQLSLTFYRNHIPFRSLLIAAAPFNLTNSYGLFAVMTTQRLEIVVEGSDDGKEWKEYGFKYKPGALDRRPAFVAPHQPRLDWQMWFAALGTVEQNPWFLNFLARLLQGSAPVLALISDNPFPDHPPRFVRAELYDYKFAPAADRKKGLWWTRDLKGLYCPPASLKAGTSSPPR